MPLFRSRSLLAMPLLLAALGACSIDVNQPETTVWEGALVPQDLTLPLSGSVAAVSQGLNTQASIRVLGAEPSTQFRWMIRRGSCDQPGDRVAGAAAYPRLEADDTGEATVDTIVSERLRSDGTYHAVVLPDAEAEGAEPVLACADLHQRNF